MSTPRGKMVNAFDPASLSGLSADTAEAIRRRQRLLGPAYRLFYKDPVQVSRGQGTKLYDRAGHEYLDAYNNVVPLGHCHPRVVEAVTRQMQTLCTHTRYIQDGILDYAESLLPGFGGQIGASGHMMFTCTGSEANDLAMRIARHVTGRRGIICTAEAYHGNSDLTASFSPSLGDQSPLGAAQIFQHGVFNPERTGHPARAQACFMRQQKKVLHRCTGAIFAATLVHSLFRHLGHNDQDCRRSAKVFEIAAHHRPHFFIEQFLHPQVQFFDAAFGNIRQIGFGRASQNIEFPRLLIHCRGRPHRPMDQLFDQFARNRVRLEPTYRAAFLDCLQ